MQKINRTTNDRTLDEDLRRLYAEVTSLRADLDALKKPTTTTKGQQIDPLPPILPGQAGQTVTPVEAASVVGTNSDYSASDHAHEGVHSIAVTGPITGDALFQAGTGMLLGQAGNTIVFNAVFGTVPPVVVLPAASPYTVGGGDITVFADTTTGAITIQLVGGAINTGRFVWICNRGTTANNVTVTATSGSVLNITNITPSGSVLYHSNGSNWYSIMNSTGN